MSFRNINKKYLMIVGLIWLGSFILFSVAYMLLLGPQYKSKKRVDSRFAEVKQAYDSAMIASKEETQNKIKKEIEDLQNKLKSFTVDFDDSANLTFDISQVANDKKVDSFSIRMQENTRGSAGTDLQYFKENRIDIGFSGDFIQFATFLNALERNEPVVFVDNFKISRSTIGDSKHRVNMNLAVFVRKQQES